MHLPADDELSKELLCISLIDRILENLQSDFLLSRQPDLEYLAKHARVDGNARGGPHDVGLDVILDAELEHERRREPNRFLAQRQEILVLGQILLSSLSACRQLGIDFLHYALKVIVDDSRRQASRQDSGLDALAQLALRRDANVFEGFFVRRLDDFAEVAIPNEFYELDDAVDGRGDGRNGEHKRSGDDHSDDLSGAVARRRVVWQCVVVFRRRKRRFRREYLRAKGDETLNLFFHLGAQLFADFVSHFADSGVLAYRFGEAVTDEFLHFAFVEETLRLRVAAHRVPIQRFVYRFVCLEMPGYVVGQSVDSVVDLTSQLGHFAGGKRLLKVG